MKRSGVLLAVLLAFFVLAGSASAGTKPTLESLAKAVAELRADNAAQARQIKSLEAVTRAQAAAIAAIQGNKALALGPYVQVSRSTINGVVGPHILFTGVNVHIRSGSGATSDNTDSDGTLTGRGNLFIGYDEPVSGGGSGPQPRTGSHNLVVGAEHTFQSYGGFVAGWRNLILAPWASVSGGAGNEVTGTYASISGRRSQQPGERRLREREWRPGEPCGRQLLRDQRRR